MFYMASKVSEDRIKVVTYGRVVYMTSEEFARWGSNNGMEQRNKIIMQSSQGREERKAMKTIIVNNAIVLNQVKKHVGNVSEFYTAKMRIDNKTINVTYDCKSNNLIIHEWYEIKPDALELVTLLVKTCFNRIMT